jgi:hypothetical protein
MANELSIFRGDAASFAVALTLGGSPINLDLYDTFFTVKKRLTDPDSSAVIRKNSASAPTANSGGIVITEASAGKLSIDLLHNDTKTLLSGDYVYGINCVKKSDPALVYTLLEGTFSVSLDVGIRTSGDPT